MSCGIVVARHIYNLFILLSDKWQELVIVGLSGWGCERTGPACEESFWAARGSYGVTGFPGGIY